MDPGLKGCQYLLGKVPSWVHLTDREKMEVRRRGWGRDTTGHDGQPLARGLCDMRASALACPLTRFAASPGPRGSG